MEFKIGADPEFFLRDKATGKFVSAHGIIPGTKRNPLKVEKGAVQVDGMALEFNIDPVTDADSWVGNITTVIAQMREMVDSQLEFVFQPTAQFGKEYIDSQPEAAKELGCEPDYNAYTGEVNPKPNADLGFRTASGHVHIGWTDQQDITDSEHLDACKMLVKQLDCFLASAAFAWDRDDIRQTMYGAPGAFRPKHYGVEYRVLSNAWLNDERSMRYVFNQTQQAANSLMQQMKVYNSYPDFKSWLNHEAGIESIYNAIRYTNPHQSSSDSNYLFGLFKKLMKEGYERPIIADRMKKINEEMYFVDKRTKELIPWDQADYSLHTHSDEYVRYCKKWGLAKPDSRIHAIELYQQHNDARIAEQQKAFIEAHNTAKTGKSKANVYKDIWTIPTITGIASR